MELLFCAGGKENSGEKGRLFMRNDGWFPAGMAVGGLTRGFFDFWKGS